MNMVTNMFWMFWIAAQLSILSASGENQFDSQQQATWFDARKKCMMEGGRLTIASETVATYCGNTDYNKRTDYWTGYFSVFSDWISIDGCFQGKKKIPGNFTRLTFKECLKTCNSAFVCHKTNIAVCSCVEIDYNSNELSPIEPCINPASGIQNDLWLMFNGHHKYSSEKLGTCVPCSQNERLCRYKKEEFLEMHICNVTAHKGKLIFRLNTTHIDNGTMNNFSDPIKCGFIDCKSQSKNPTFQSCNETKSYLCNQDTTLTTVLDRSGTVITKDGTVVIESTTDQTALTSDFHPSNTQTSITQTILQEVTEQTTPQMQFTNGTKKKLDMTTVSVNHTTYKISTGIPSTAKVTTSTRNKEKETYGITTGEESTISNKNNIIEQSSTSSSVKPSTPKRFETNEDQSKSPKITGPLVGGILGVVLIVCLTIIAFCKYRNTGFFRKQSYADESKEMNGLSHKSANISEYHDIVTNSNNGVENGVYGIDNGEIKDTPSFEIKTETIPNNVYAVVSKQHLPKSKTLELAKRDSKQVETEGEYDILNKPLDREENQLQHNVYDSCQGIRSDTDPTYNTTYSARVDIPNDDDMYDHTSNVAKM